ncbi:MAG: hypothetical protein IPK19_17820 [Chloroflexi bacterium]|nr:hypothetical protein [Chloroflexota bacterium]
MNRFMKGIDYDGLADVRVTGWHRKLHIFQIPFYYVEYGLAQIGAVQVWMNSLQDAAKATADYRRAGAGWHGAASRAVRCGGGALRHGQQHPADGSGCPDGDDREPGRLNRAAHRHYL